MLTLLYVHKYYLYNYIPIYIHILYNIRIIYLFRTRIYILYIGYVKLP